MDNDEQRISSAINIQNALIDCICVLRSEEKKNYGGEWNVYIDDLVDYMMDSIADISGALRKDVDIPFSPEYEHLTGHEYGVAMGRV